jgi:hypothetical protein
METTFQIQMSMRNLKFPNAKQILPLQPLTSTQIHHAQVISVILANSVTLAIQPLSLTQMSIRILKMPNAQLISVILTILANSVTLVIQPLS